jgi:AraC-like DNA-binding protein
VAALIKHYLEARQRVSHCQLTETISLEDLIVISNVPGRTLNEHFRRFLGISPMAYIKRERLKLARGMLMGNTQLTVTEAATGCGFSHLGRPSIDYALAFGESSSTTRESARRGPKFPCGVRGNSVVTCEIVAVHLDRDRRKATQFSGFFQCGKAAVGKCHWGVTDLVPPSLTALYVESWAPDLKR